MNPPTKDHRNLFKFRPAALVAYPVAHRFTTSAVYIMFHAPYSTLDLPNAKPSSACVADLALGGLSTPLVPVSSLKEGFGLMRNRKH